jgi:hypothetical protein
MSTVEAEERLKRLIKLLCVASPSILKIIYHTGKSLPETQFGRKNLLHMVINAVRQALTRAYKHNVFDLDETMEVYEKIAGAYWKYYGDIVISSNTNVYIKFLDEAVSILEENPRYVEWTNKMWSDLQSLYKEMLSS